MSNRPNWDKTFIDILHVISKRSCCIKYNISSILVRGQQILAMGYNGTLPGKKECYNYWLDWYQANQLGSIEWFPEWTKTDEFKKLHSEWSKLNELHAEANVLASISKDNIQPGDTLYTMYAPCETCAKSIVYHGIKIVKYLNDYSRDDGIKILKNNGVTVIKLLG